MGRKKKLFMVVDTETCTLPFANEICKGPEQQKKVAIAKPLVYDIGWVVADRQGNILAERNYLVQETFFVPSVFSTAYYREKRPKYMEMLSQGEIEAKSWNEIMEIFIADADEVDVLTAYNATFDFKKAIPFTERYIKHLYSADYNEWEKKQRYSAKKIANGENPRKNADFTIPVLRLRDKEYPIADLWAIACDRLININKYRNFCLENNLLTNSAEFFSTNAEVCFRFMADQWDFIEDHTALSDAKIELFLLTKANQKGAVDAYLDSFPFRKLGRTIPYVEEKKPKYKAVVAEALKQYLEEQDALSQAFDGSRYWKGKVNTYLRLIGMDTVDWKSYE